MTARETYTIEVVSPTDRWRAFEFLLGSDVTQAPLLPSDQLVWAVGGGQVAGVAWAQRTSAATATVGMPRLCTTAPADLRTLLLTALIGRLHQKFSFEHLRALLARGDTEGRILLRSLGFKRVMEVDLLTASPGPCDPPLDVQLIPASADERIPLLDRLRKAFEEDEGAPNRIDWTDDEVFLNDDDDCYFVQYQDRKVGNIVVNRGVGQESLLEIRYLGIDREVRRRGIATSAVCRLRQQAVTGQRLTTAVLSRNIAARRVYQRAGFHLWRRYDVWVKNLR